MERLAARPSGMAMGPAGAPRRGGDACWHCGTERTDDAAPCGCCGAGADPEQGPSRRSARAPVFATAALGLGAIMTGLGSIAPDGFGQRPCGCEPPPLVPPPLPGPAALAAGVAAVAFAVAVAACVVRFRETAALRAALCLGIAALALALFGVAGPFLEASIVGAVGPWLATGGTLMGITGASIALDAVMIDRGASYRRT